MEAVTAAAELLQSFRLAGCCVSRQKQDWRAEQERLGVSVGPSEDLEASFSTFLYYLLLCCLDESFAGLLNVQIHFSRSCSIRA